jgi:hypothetical protein
MRVGVLIFIFLTTSTNQSVTTDVPRSYLSWSERSELTWKDFKGKAKKHSRYDAETYASVRHSYRITESKILFELNCYFDKKISWVGKIKSTELLGHEQLHFDIAELSARKMREAYSNYTFVSTKASTNDFREIDRAQNKMWESLNINYDSETNHGIDKVSQREWSDKISEELLNLNEYSVTTFEIVK